MRSDREKRWDKEYGTLEEHAEKVYNGELSKFGGAKHSLWERVAQEYNGAVRRRLVEYVTENSYEEVNWENPDDFVDQLREESETDTEALLGGDFAV